jgi:hypothetical protein
MKHYVLGQPICRDQCARTAGKFANPAEGAPGALQKYYDMVDTRSRVADGTGVDGGQGRESAPHPAVDGNEGKAG